MKRFTIIISSCLCALALAACGSSGLHFSGTAATTTSASAGVTTTPTRAARPTGGGRNPIAGAKAFTTALGARQFRAACDDLSTEARQEMVAFSKASRCPAALSGLFNFPGATAALQALKVVKPVTVQTGGDQAI